LSQLDAEPPVPISAHFAAGQLVVTFDRLLQPTLVLGSNWFFRIANSSYAITFAEAIGSTIVLSAEPDEADPGPDIVTYRATVPDVLSLPGTPAAPFTDFPIT
jgi:hypothetical protein